MNFDLDVISKALQVLLEATLPVVAAMAAAWLNGKYQELRARQTEQNLYLLDSFIRTAVFAAEQLKLSGMADDKLDYVIERAQEYIDRTGLTISAAELRARIEAAVIQNFPKLPATNTPATNTPAGSAP